MTPWNEFLAWARTLYDENNVMVNVQRADLERLSAVWVGIDVPSIGFDPAQFGGVPDSTDWDSQWEIPIMFGSGKMHASGEEAFAVCWENARRMLRAILGDDGPDWPNAWFIAPLSLEPEEKWAEDEQGALQTILTLTIQINATGLEP